MADDKKIEEKWRILSRKLADREDADVILYSGEIKTDLADQLIAIARDKVHRKNVVLVLTTNGGLADAAYRIARCLQQQYTKVILYIYGYCKSAGTLVAIGAHEIVLSDYGEFGPLDVQLGKKDELFENVSGLNLTQALTSLNTRTMDLFRQMVMDLRNGSNGRISTKMASEIASSLAIGIYEKIYAQIDPEQLGAIERAINIASDYGKRLQTNNVKRGAVDRLISGYPSHNFIIDRAEAKDLFKIVRAPDELEEELAECINWVTREPARESFVMKLNLPPEPQTESQNETHTGQSQQSAEGAGSGVSADHDAAPREAQKAERPKPRVV